MSTNPKQYNYLHKKRKHKGSGSPSSTSGSQAPTGVQFSRLAPHATISVPPLFMFILGALGILFGVACNMLQWFSTFTAMMDIMTPNGSVVNNASQPYKYLIAALIATAVQFGLLLIIFKIDHRWKKNAGGKPIPVAAQLQGYGAATIEVVQHMDIVSLYGIGSFVIDTIGDFIFVSGILAGLDPTTQMFMTFIYAAALYCLSTVAFVRSIEYVWSGIAATAHFLKQSQP